MKSGGTMENGQNGVQLVVGMVPDQAENGVAVHAANPFANAVSGVDGQVPTAQQSMLGKSPSVQSIKKPCDYMGIVFKRSIASR